MRLYPTTHNKKTAPFPKLGDVISGRMWRLGLFAWMTMIAAIAILGGCDCQDVPSVSLEAEITSIPKALVFESVAIGDQLTREIVVKNTGRGSLIIKELSLINQSGGNPFSLLTQKNYPLEIEPGQSERFQIRYEPKLAGIAKGVLRTISNAQNANPAGEYDIEIRSVELSADISAEPNPMDFGSVKPGEKKTLALQVTNKGSAPLQLFAADFEKNAENEFAIETNLAYPVDVAPGKSLEIQISYSPKKPTAADETLILRNNTTNNSRYPVRLVGLVAAPDIEVKPLKLVFDKTAMGTKGVQSFEIFNRGTTNLEIQGITLGANSSSDFDLPSLPTFPLSIEPQKSHKIDVEYNSKDTKDDTGTVKIVSNDPDSPEVKVELEGKAQGCNLIAAPTQLHFTRSDRKQVSILNQGNRPCIYKGAAFSAATSKEFSFFLPPPAAQALAPGQKLDFMVQFVPKDAQADQGALVIESDDPDQPRLEVALTSALNSANACEITAQPTILQFGFLGTGKSRQLPVELSNSGYGDCFVTVAEINPNPSNVFSLPTKLPAQGQVIPSGSKYSMTVAFTPGSAGTFQGTLKLTTNDGRGQPVEIKLVGSGGTLCLEALPDPLDFGAVRVNCSTGNQPLEIFNLCTSAVSVTKLNFGASTNQKHAEFAIKVAPNLPFSIPYGQSMTIQMSYVARDLGPDLGTLEVSNTMANQSPIVATLRGEGVSTDDQKDVFRQLKQPQIDILFDIDDSGSMGDDQSNVANNLSSFIQWASTLQVDYQIGVTTTDAGKQGCLRGNPKIVTPQTPNLIATLQANVRVGTSGSGYEQGLQTSYLALTPPSITGCNNGFYRPDASLSIIYISDEPDYSQQSVNFFINFLRSLKGIRNPDKIRVSAIGSQAASTCQTSNSCRYYAVAMALRGIYDSIRNTNWGSTLSNLGAVTFGYRTQFFLSRPADEKTIQVKVNGQVVTKDAANGWSYDSTNNTVNFGKNAVPPAGALIEVSYKALCLPP